MPHVSAMNEEQRRLFELWKAAGEPNTTLWAIRSAKDRVRAERARGVDPAAIEAEVIDRAERACEENAVKPEAREWFVGLIRVAVLEALAEPPQI